MISIIVAIAEDYGIGYKNELLWHIPEDLKRFKQITSGKTVVMGKRTWESLPKRPLPLRKNIVITDNPEDKFDGAVMAYSIPGAVEMSGNDEIFIIGGGSIYKQFMLLADRLYITHVHSSSLADVYFPEIDKSVWNIVSREEFASQDNIPAYSRIIYERAR